MLNDEGQNSKNFESSPCPSINFKYTTELNNDMTEAVTMDMVYDELKSLKEEITFIKKHMFDPDTIMTTEEKRRFEQSLKELKSGKTTSLSTLKKEFGL